jgi:hypothetical protein
LEEQKWSPVQCSYVFPQSHRPLTADVTITGRQNQLETVPKPAATSEAGSFESQRLVLLLQAYGS